MKKKSTKPAEVKPPETKIEEIQPVQAPTTISQHATDIAIKIVKNIVNPSTKTSDWE